MGHAGTHFLSDAAQTPLDLIILAVRGGAVFNVANLAAGGRHRCSRHGCGLSCRHRAGVSRWRDFKLPGQPGRQSLAALWRGCDWSPWPLFSMPPPIANARARQSRVTTTRGIVLSLVAGVLMGTFYPLVARALSSTRQTRSRPLRGCILLRPRRAALHRARQPAADGQAAGRQASGRRSRLPDAPMELAHCRFARRGDLVHGRGGQLCSLGRSSGGAGSLLLHRPGRHHGLSMLGSFCLARVCRSAALGQRCCCSSCSSSSHWVWARLRWLRCLASIKGREHHAKANRRRRQHQYGSGGARQE